MSQDLEAERQSLRSLLRRMLQVSTESVAPRIGDLAESMGLISHENLTRALERQRGNGGGRLLGQVMVDEGFLKENQVQMILREQARIAMSSSEAEEAGDDGLRGVAESLQRAKDRRS